MTGGPRTARDVLTPPRPRGWTQRADWLATQQRQRSIDLAQCHGPQAAAMIAEMARAYCAGAYAAVIVLAQAVLDAEMAARVATTDLPLLDRNYTWLRQYRNKLAHGVNDDGEINLTLSIDAVGEDQPAMDRDARRAIILVFEAVFDPPG